MNNSKAFFNLLVCNDLAASKTHRYTLYSLSAKFSINAKFDMEFSNDTIFSSCHQGFIFYSNSSKTIFVLDNNFQISKYKSHYPEEISCVFMTDNLIFAGSFSGKIFLTSLNECEAFFEILDLRYPIKKMCISEDFTSLFVALNNSIFKIELSSVFNSLKPKKLFQTDTTITEFQLGFTYSTMCGHSGLLWILLEGGDIYAVDIKSSNIVCNIPTSNFIKEPLIQFSVDKIGNMLFACSKSKILSVNLNSGFFNDESVKILDSKMIFSMCLIYIESSVYLFQFGENVIKIFSYPSMDLYTTFPLDIPHSWHTISSCININYEHSLFALNDKSNNYWFKNIKNLAENINTNTKEMQELLLLNDRLCDLLNKRQGVEY